MQEKRLLQDAQRNDSKVKKVMSFFPVKTSGSAPLNAACEPVDGALVIKRVQSFIFSEIFVSQFAVFGLLVVWVESQFGSFMH